jgi:hypothetical protein
MSSATTDQATAVTERNSTTSFSVPRRKLRWIRYGKLRPNVANNVIYAMETSLLKLDIPYTISPRNETTHFINRAMAKLKLVRAGVRWSDKAYLVPLGHTAEWRFFPLTYFHEIVPWCFDSWPNLRDRIEQMLVRNRVRVAMFTARQSAEYFKRKLGIDAFWMPEACEAEKYRPEKLLRDRAIDVLELGRKYDRYHDAITPRLEQLGKKHLYEKIKGQLIFSGADGLAQGFADSKISVCFPSSMTHPERSGDCETVTLRYFESMASRCLIVGHGPAELQDIMGYNPVIEADWDNAADQIEQIVQNIDRYQEQVDRNYEIVLKHGVWDVRIAELLAELAKRGYRP